MLIYDIYSDIRPVVRTLVKAHRINDLIMLNDSLVRIRINMEITRRYTHSTRCRNNMDFWACIMPESVLDRCRAVAKRVEILGK